MGLADLVALPARVLLALIFVASGVGKIFEFSSTQDYMAAEGMQLTALFLIGAIVLEIVGGLSIVLGYRARLGAILLIIFIVPATLIFHDFWTIEDPEATKMQMIMFMKNLSITGGLLLVLAHGSGRLSLDGRPKPRRLMRPQDRRRPAPANSHAGAQAAEALCLTRGT